MKHSKRKIEKMLKSLGLKTMVREPWREGVKDEWYARYYSRKGSVVLVTVGFVTGEAFIEILNAVSKFRLEV
jgi:hypothetical protein